MGEGPRTGFRILVFPEPESEQPRGTLGIFRIDGSFPIRHGKGNVVSGFRPAHLAGSNTQRRCPTGGAASQDIWNIFNVIVLTVMGGQPDLIAHTAIVFHIIIAMDRHSYIGFCVAELLSRINGDRRGPIYESTDHVRIHE